MLVATEPQTVAEIKEQLASIVTGNRVLIRAAEGHNGDIGALIKAMAEGKQFEGKEHGYSAAHDVHMFRAGTMYDLEYLEKMGALECISWVKVYPY